MGARLDRAWLLYERARYDMAEKEVGLALAQAPNNPAAHSLMAMCLVEREEWDRATDHAKQGVAGAPDHAYSHYVLARVWAERNYLAEAETAIREALRIDPDDPDYHVFLGGLRLRRSDWPGARAAAEEALALDPEHVDAVNLRAQALRGQGQKRTAARELDEALRKAPEDAWTHANLGWNYLEQGNRKKAMEHFREALRMDPELEWARLGALETLKSHNVLYRGLLNYFLWMEKLGQRGQWMVILGAYVAYRVVLGTARANPALAPWLTPLIVAYILFALGTILAVPLGNLALRLHPFGRLALSRDERMGANWVGGFLLAALVAAIALWITGGTLAQEALIFFGLMTLPVAVTTRCESPWPRKALLIYTLIVAAMGLLRIGLILAAFASDLRENDPGADLWFAVVRPLNVLFPLGALLSIWMVIIVGSIRWKK